MGSTTCASFQTPCGPRCCPRDTFCGNPATQACCGTGTTYCPGGPNSPETCCNPGEQCHPRGGCCPKGYTINPSGGCCAPHSAPCGTICCDPNTVCANPDIEYCCAPRQRACQGRTTVDCCNPNQACCDGKCCKPGLRCHKGKCKKCPPKTKECGDFNCCDHGEPCCNGKCCKNGQHCCYEDHCCNKGHSCCGKGCCDAKKEHCCGDHCCPKGHDCCGAGCCPKGKKCAQQSGRLVCCSPSNMVAAGSVLVCCGPGRIAVGDRCCPADTPNCSDCNPPCKGNDYCFDGQCFHTVTFN